MSLFEHLRGLSRGKENSAFMVRSIMRERRRMGSSAASLGILHIAQREFVVQRM
jgi:hypothetical protein